MVVVASLVGAIAVFGMNQAHAYHLNVGRITDAQVLGNVAGSLVVMGLLVAVVFATSVDTLILPGGQKLPGSLMAWVAVIATGIMLQAHLSSHLLARGAIIEYGFATQGHHLVMLAALAAAALTTSLSVELAMLCLLAGLVVVIVPAAFRALQLAGVSIQLSAAPWRAALRYGSVILVGNLMWGLLNRVDYLLMTALVGARPVGIYSVATNIAELFLIFPQAVSSVLLPAVSKIGSEGGLGIVARATRLVTAATLAFSVVGALAGAMLLVRVFGTEYAGAVRPLLILYPGVVSLSIMITVFQYYYGTGRPGLPTIIVTASTVLNLALGFLWIPDFGPSGAAAAASVANAAGAAAAITMVCAGTGIPVRTVLVLEKADILHATGVALRHLGRLRRRHGIGGKPAT